MSRVYVSLSLIEALRSLPKLMEFNIYSLKHEVGTIRRAVVNPKYSEKCTELYM